MAITKPAVTILGGGPAGLAIGYYSRQAGLPIALYEARDRVGGNCVTLRHGPFRFDSGAHRFHDKNAEVTRDVQRLVGADLRKIEVPSQIWQGGRFVDFPLSPLNLLKALGPWSFLRAGLSLLRARFGRATAGANFREFAIRSYGHDIAARFLLDYSEKLWGAPCERLSPQIAGTRLKGLGLMSVLVEALFGRRARTQHLDGAFYYPRQGYGRIVERLAEACGHENIHLESRVTKIIHSGVLIRAVEINGRTLYPVDELACTLPVPLVLRMLEPAAPAELVALGQTLRYRNVILVALFLKKDRLSRNGSIYFPDVEFPFTRVYEPRNRSPEMAPPGHTSLVAEIPCQAGDDVWSSAPETLIETVTGHFLRLGWFERREIVGATTYRLDHAYPILELGHEERLTSIAAYLRRFSNLRVAGRNGCFLYTHLHDMLRFGIDVAAEYAGRRRGAQRAA